MHTRVITKITTDIDLETMASTHRAEVGYEDDIIPELVAYAAALAGCNAAVITILEQHPEWATDE